MVTMFLLQTFTVIGETPDGSLKTTTVSVTGKSYRDALDYVKQIAPHLIALQGCTILFVR